MSQRRKIVTCHQCGLEKSHQARGLCDRCYVALPIPTARRRWRGMIQRCTNPSHQAWPLYGGRGIRVCARWLNSFDAYYQDVGDAPAGMSLDRVDNDGDYEPGNVRWASPSTQALNQRHYGRLKTHCVRGHEFDGDNTHVGRDGRRYCRTCRRETQRRYLQRRAS